jgi:methionine synthase I (cobalamin-dependent)/5,10-methylenetetrahydrofolate reductase
MNIRSYLSQGKPLLFDGAMGTLLAARSDNSAEQCEQANLHRPEEVLAIHREYLEAGCRAVKTNTFALGPLFASGRDAEGAELIEAGCELAKKASAPYDAYVFADIGPSPQFEKEPGKLYCREADVFLAQGVTCFLAETLSCVDGISELAAHLKKRCPESFIIVSFAVGADGFTRDGLSGQDLFRQAAAMADVDAVGFNCMSGPHHMLSFIQNLDTEGKILSVMPNAGYPTVLGLHTVFQGGAAYFADHVARMVPLGAMIVGGCCGTTPLHIRALRDELNGAGMIVRVSPERAKTVVREEADRNTLWDKLERGERIIAVELDPPTDDSISSFMEGVRALQKAGADAVTIADCPVGRPRADSSLLACKIKRELGMEPLPHMSCRDRNLNATKALLLGLSMENVHNVLLVTGDPIPTADRDEVKSVFNFNSRKLIRYVSDLNENVLHTPFRIFGALNVNANNFDIQLKIAQEKEESGASGFLTQPVLSREALDNLKLARETLHGKILGGVFPVVSYRNACFLNNEIAGIRVSDEIAELYNGKSREEAEELAVRISTDIIRDITPYTDGLYLMTPFSRVPLIARIIGSAEGEGGPSHCGERIEAAPCPRP